MITLQIYKYTGRPDTLKKNLGTPVLLHGYFYTGYNVLTPTVKLVAGILNNAFNYVYIPEKKRYYFVTDIKVLSSDTCEITLREDVLQTYQKEILQAAATLTKSQTGNKYLSSISGVHDIRPHLEKLTFAKSLFNDTGNIILVAVKGSK